MSTVVMPKPSNPMADVAEYLESQARSFLLAAQSLRRQPITGSSSSKPSRSHISPAGRKRIAEAQAKRWRTIQGGKSAAKTPAARKTA